MRRAARWQRSGFLFLLFSVVTCVAPVSAEQAGGTYEDWLRRRDAVSRDPDVVRYHTFEGLQAAGDAVPNLAGDKAEPLAFGLEAAPGAAKDELRLVEGRWASKKAVRLDQGFFQSKAPDVAPAGFTAVLWFRKQGPGAHKGNGGTPNGMLLAAGDGYWSGWRLHTGYPSKTIGFEIGRPQPSHAVHVGTGPVADGVWHHLAATWDGKEMRVYVDGDLASAGPHAGPYAPTKGPFRVGFAGAGVGSVVLDVDEVVLYGRALAPEEVFQDVYFYAPPAKELRARLGAAGAAEARKDHAAAERELAAAASTAGLHADVAAALRLRRGGALRSQGRTPAAAQEYARVLDAPGVPDRLGRQAMEAMLGLLQEGAAASLPRGACERLLAMPGLAAKDRLSLRLGLGHAMAAAKDAAGARAAYAALAGDAAAPPAWRSLARLCEAQVAAGAKDWDGAKAACEQVKALPGAPRHHVGEADDRLREIGRLRAGLPARDPLAGRVAPPKRTVPGATLVVAPTGKDDAPGTKEAPFATLERARDAIRAMKKAGGLPPGGVEVLVRGGVYPVKAPFALSEPDSGAPGAPVVYRAADGEAPRFDAGARVGGFQPVRDAAVLARLPEEARGKVVQADLKAQGIDPGTFEPGGFGSGRGFRTHPMLELYADGQPQPLARWPNEGYVKIAEVKEKDGHAIHGLAGSKQGVFTCAEDRPRRWKGETDPWLYGYWFWDWADSYEKVAAIDPEKKEIALAPPFHSYGYRKGQRWCAVNLLSEIDRPGEWHLDRSGGILYWWPPSDPAKSVVEVSRLDRRVLELESVSHVAFEGLTWEGGRGDAVLVKGGASVRLAGCTIRRFGGVGVEIQGGTGHLLLSCDIHTLGRSGAQVAGGDRKSLAPGGHVVENCRIHHLSRIDHTYTPAVLLNGAGNRIAHNLFHDSASSAMRVEGNDHVVEYNEVHRVLLESDDQGGADVWGDPTYRGNVYRYNHWHDMGNGLGCGQAGIRLDDAISGTLIIGNVFRRCADGGFGGVQIHGGKENWVENNLFVECKAAVSFSPWGEARWRQYLAKDARDRVEAVRAAEPPYAERYPELKALEANADANAVWRNVVVRCDRFLLRDRGCNDLMDNWVSGEDPGLADVAKGDFTVRPGSPLAERPGFRPIPFGEIGLYVDAYRKSK